MLKLTDIASETVFKYFEEICSVPHGSGNMQAISKYIIDFAKSRNLEWHADHANNVIVYKPASKGYENSESIILQGHLDMVCQKTEDYDIDFEKDGIDVYVDNGFVTARGTTLGADNGIAVAMILSILSDNSISHPDIEAVFTTDEEIGMIGAGKLDMSKLKSKRMINLDAEQEDTVTASCAGGSDFEVKIPIVRVNSQGFLVKICIKGLKGGHSGVEIDKGRINSNILTGRILNHLKEHTNFEIISITGGNKANAIPNRTDVILSVTDPDKFKEVFSKYIGLVEKEIKLREPDFTAELFVADSIEMHSVFSETIRDEIIYILNRVVDGVVTMSAQISGLVETSLNIGILSTNEDTIVLHHALRSNKVSSLMSLEDELKTFYRDIKCNIETYGHYPPWEYNPNSQLRSRYLLAYEKIFGSKPKIEAIHAGLECGLFCTAIEGLDCIAIGPQLFDVHTVNERLDIVSTQRIYSVLIELLKSCK